MTRVYWRIFLTFWLVLVMAVVVTVGLNAIMFRDEVAYTRADTLRGSLDALSEQAERRLQQSGTEGLRDWLRELQSDSPMPPLLIIGPDGDEILGRALPPGFRKNRTFGRGAGIRDDRPSGPRARFRPAIRRFADVDGRQYVMVLPPIRPRSGDWFATTRLRSVFPVVLVLISGIVCLLLARYLTRPIAAFRRAGQSIAAGDLGARVGTDIARRTDEFGDLARDFDDMAGRVEQLVESQQRLLRDVSHELRSPLARLQAATGLLRQRGGDDPNLDRIEREIDVLNVLIGQVLGFSRIQSRTSLEAERVDLTELVRGVVDDATFEGAAHERRIEFAPASRAVVLADPTLLRSALDNVVRNALQYATEVVTVDIGPQASAGSVTIRVQDDGSGVAVADLPHLFDPFFTGETPQAGAGIGLAIARRVVELHGGTIAASNADGGGLVVTIVVPGGPPPGEQGYRA